MRCKAGFFSGFTSDNPIIVISGLVAYFAARDGVTKDGSNRVSQWNDQSGNGNHATADEGEEPLYLASGIGGQPALDFDGDEIFTIPHSSSINISTMSVFMVVKRDGAGTGNGFALMRNDGRWGIALNVNDTINFFVTSHSDEPTDFDTGFATGSSPHLIGFTNDGSDLFAYQDGSKSSSLLSRTFNTSSDPEGSLQIGGYDESFGGTEKVNAKIAEVMLFNRVLTAGEIDTIEAYVSGRYGISIA
jgi:hypothetical protein